VSALMLKIDKDAVWRMLQFIPGQDRETWISIGMALKSEFADRGFSMFDQWSKSADNYDSKSVVSVWKSFRGGNTTIATLVHFAKANGWHKDSEEQPIPVVPTKTKAPQECNFNTRNYGLSLWLSANKDDQYVASHQYAISKRIGWAAGAGRGVASGSIIGQQSDCIIVPIRNIDTNKIQSVQCINQSGIKQTFGGIKGGALILGNTIDKKTPWYICEGWASAVSTAFHHQKGGGVCAASFGKSNQQATANLIESIHNPDDIVILVEVDS
jgi:putative DNA primase/helicase